MSSLAKIIRDCVMEGEFGLLVTPYSNYNLANLPGVTWAADSGCFTQRWKQPRWWAWLERNAEYADRCLFATAPDVVGDYEKTLEVSRPWFARIRMLGYPVAFVLQDGCVEPSMVPWDEIDWVFVGGSTQYKESPEVGDLLAHAQSVGVRCHMGRVNSFRRIKLADEWGCETVDGTFLGFGPDTNLPRLRRWFEKLDALHHQQQLFDQ